MKKQMPGGYYAYGYPSSTSRSSQGHSNLPSIFDTILPLRNGPPSGLYGKGLPNAGLFLPTTPRERAERGGGNRLYSSDSTPDRIRGVNRLHTSHSTTRHQSGERRSSQPVGVAIAPVGAMMGGVSAPLAPITRRLPSGVLRGGTLPPIGAEAMDSGFTSTVTDVAEDDSVFGTEEGGGGVVLESSTDDSDTDDEVSC